MGWKEKLDMKYKIRTTIVMCLLILCVSGCDMRQEEKTVKENPETATISIENGKEERILEKRGD